MNIKYLIYSFLIFYVNKVLSIPNDEDRECTTKTIGPGKCVSPGQCEALIRHEIQIEMCNKCQTRGLVCCPMNASVNLDSSKLVPAIINGRPVENNQYPFMAALGTKSTNSDVIQWKCGGSIISQNLILTAAHCEDITNIMVGTNNLIDIRPDQTINQTEFEFIPHELYHQRDIGNHPGPTDIAVIKLKTNLEFNESVNSITLASVNYLEGGLSDIATAIGFGSKQIYGFTSSKLLTQIELYKEQCSVYSNTITNQICYGKGNKTNRGICRGDGGGPLFVKNTINGNYIQIGIASFSFVACALTPAGFTSIPPFRDWINTQSNDTDLLQI